MKFSLSLLVGAFATLASAQDLDIPTTAVEAGQFGTLVAALTAADLVETLSAPNGPFTVFAPTDDAFALIPSEIVECLLLEENIGALTNVLTYHVVGGTVLSTDLTYGLTAETLNGESVVFDLSNGVKVNNSTVILPDVLASNGVIHVIDQVLIPPSVDIAAFAASCAAPAEGLDIPGTAVAADDFEVLVTALTAADLVTAISEPNGPFTVFAPTDEAFGALPEGLVGCLVEPENVGVLSTILLYHVASGSVLSTDLEDGQTIPTLQGDVVTVDLSDGVKINDSTVVAADVIATNGVIHVIDAVLVPPGVDVAGFLEACLAPPEVSASPSSAPSAAALDIAQTAIAAGTFTTLVTALTATDLVGAVSEPNGPLTVFAPTDDAFAALPEGLVGCLVEDTDVLSSILLYHVVAGQVLSTDLMDGMTAETLNGASVTVDLSDGVKINESTVIAPDVLASNGVIHVIDAVLVPPGLDVAGFLEACLASESPTVTPPSLDIAQTAIAAGSFETLVTALTAADLVAAVSEPNGPLTVFAPTDDAFAALPEGLVGCLVEDTDVLSSILLYHVVAGQVLSTDLMDGMMAETLNGASVTVDLSDGVKINESTVIAADVLATNGVIHVIDAVLVPPGLDVAGFLEACLTSESPTVTPPSLDIAQTAIAAGSFETLVTALTAADLVAAVSEPNGPLTVFAPTDDAFAALPEGLVGCLVEDVGALSTILLYHVVAGQVLSTDLMDGMMAETLNGASVTVDLSDGVKINDSNVITPDVLASNGVIHVIDAVLVPPGLDVAGFLEACLAPAPVDIPQTAIAAGSFTTLVTALTAADLVTAVSEPNGPFTVFAPTDDALAALPEGLVGCLVNETDVLSSILLYHVVAGEVLSTDLMDGMMAETLNGASVTVDLSDGVKIDAATVITPDVIASNGVIHVIDSVLVPAGVDVAGFLETCLGEPEPVDPMMDIAQTAVAAGVFETLVAALTAADLVGAVSEPNGPLTVFAPTDDAFAALPPALVPCLLADVPTLSAILTYHVVSGEVLSTDLMDGMTATTLQGEDVTVDLSDGVKINESTVTTADVMASNGVIHIIDSVLVPPSVDVGAYLAACTADAPTDAPVAAPTDAPDDSGASSSMMKIVSAVVAAMTIFAL